MDRDENGDFSTGNSGGGAKRGYGINPSFLHPRGEESPPRNECIDLNRYGLNTDNRPALGNGEGVANWIEECQDDHFSRCDEEDSFTSSSEPSCYGRDNIGYEDESDRTDDAELGEQRGAVGYASFIGYSGFIGFPHLHAGYGFAGYLGAPVMGHGGLALRLNGSNAVPCGGRLEVNNGGGYDIQAVNGCNNGGLQGQPYFGGEFNEMHADGPAGAPNENGFQNENIFHYTTTTAYAHRRRNGEVLSDMLCLRDSHIFDIMNATDYSSAITQICNNMELQQAMINHLDCLKALLSRDLALALTKQIACVNAVMRLLNEPYSMNEEWTLPVIHNVTFDLRIINDRATAAGCRGRVIVRYDWAANNPACVYHPFNCQCQQPKVYRTRNFYRRY